MLLSSNMSCRVVWLMSTYVSEETAASIFRITTCRCANLQSNFINLRGNATLCSVRKQKSL
jgi:hypothetical protein